MLQADLLGRCHYGRYAEAEVSLRGFPDKAVSNSSELPFAQDGAMAEHENLDLTRDVVKLCNEVPPNHR